MMLLYSKIVGMTVADLREQKKIGEIDDLIYNSELKIAAFVLKQQFSILPREPQIVSSDDVAALAKKGLVVYNEGAASPLRESVRIKKLTDEKFYGLKQPVISKSGQRIGSVYDYLVDSGTLLITKFYVKSLFGERIIPVSKVVSLEKRKIIIEDETESIKVPADTSELAESL